ncbi:hypothetical protein K227x_63190 [Rubripirellula lacrimiformis]|uniref:Uncharacterized protein n=1 Tax=Rubripirellula lacrimiformis TaxID=1930273 RepID=A0A517NL84_9BACT|nr:hypothetical protein K227x_63190 [Rubripirellula lacrimiformis]
MGTRLNDGGGNGSRGTLGRSFNRAGNAPRVHAPQTRGPMGTRLNDGGQRPTRPQTRGPMGTRLNDGGQHPARPCALNARPGGHAVKRWRATPHASMRPQARGPMGTR